MYLSTYLLRSRISSPGRSSVKLAHHLKGAYSVLTAGDSKSRCQPFNARKVYQHLKLAFPSVSEAIWTFQTGTSTNCAFSPIAGRVSVWLTVMVLLEGYVLPITSFWPIPSNTQQRLGSNSVTDDVISVTHGGEKSKTRSTQGSQFTK